MSRGDESLRPLLEESLRELRRLRAERDALERAAHEPVAIVGIGCRFPGGASGPDAFWRLVRDGFDAIGPPPEGRLAAGTCPDVRVPGTTRLQPGGFLEEVDCFDAALFGVTPREAVGMDPQQRLLLEVTWEALEDACVAPDRLGGARAGVYVGLFMDDYAQLGFRSGDPGAVDAYNCLGGLRSMAAGRIAYVLGLAGPAIQVDTACSSSLVAVHLACQGLRSRECDVALAGGANLMLTPEATLGVMRLNALAADGRCKAFGAGADGFGRGEGCGVVVLKRLSDAIDAGDRIVAVVRGSAVNHDGRSNGLTAPSGPAQERVLRDALAAAGVSPAAVGYVEAHGTGTPLGDPIEAGALAAVYGEGRDRSTPLRIGSVKSNVGHLEAAAGVAALAKAALAVEHGEVPPSLHAAEPNPLVPWDGVPLRVAGALEGWPVPGGVRAAGVSAFGMSGTNVHAVLESAPELTRASAHPAERPAHVLSLTARSERALRELAGRFAERLAAGPDLALADVCFSANTGRATFPHRLAVAASSRDALAASLRAHAAGDAAPGLYTGEVGWGERPAVAFLFPGQGSQYSGMGRELYETHAVFREAVDRCADAVSGELDRPLVSVLFDGHDSRLEETIYAQPALFALEYALSRLWRSWGVEPAALLGHSVGEYVAACEAGVFSAEDAVRLVAARGRLMQELAPAGAMSCVFAPESRVRAAVDDAGGEVAVAAVNGASNVVVSGPPADVEALAARFAAGGIGVRPLPVSRAFHSPSMEPVISEFLAAARGVSFATPSLPVISNVTGTVAGPEIATPEYWARHLRATVRFGDGLAATRALDCRALLEVGPGGALASIARREGHGEVCLGGLAGRGSEWAGLLGAVARLAVRGAGPDWAAFDAGYPRAKLSLPTYPFERERFWPEPRPALEPRRTRGDSGEVALVMRSPLIDRVVYEAEIPAEALAEHTVAGRAVVPAGWHLAAVASAASDAYGTGWYTLEDVVFASAVRAPDLGPLRVQLALPRDGSGRFEIVGLSGERAAPGSAAVVGTVTRAAAPSVVPDLDGARARCVREAAPPAGGPVRLGEAFDRVLAVRLGGSEAVADLGSSGARSGTSALWRYSALLDSCMRVLAATLPGGDDGALVPFRVRRAAVALRDGGPFTGYARATGAESGDVALFDERGDVVAWIEGLELRAAAAEPSAPAGIDAEGNPARAGWLRAEAAQAPKRERFRVLCDAVRGLAARALDLGTPGEVAPGRSLFELGLDSLAALELRGDLEEALGLSLASTLVFDHPSAEAIARHLDDVAFGGDVVAKRAGAAAAEGPRVLDPAELERLAEADAEALLLDELDRLNY